MRTFALVGLAVVAFLACVVAFGYCWYRLPTVSVEQHGARVVVHTPFLGDYPSDIGLVEVVEVDTAKTLWRGAPEGDKVQMHSLVFHVGENDAVPSVFWGKFRSPGRGEALTFRLMPGTTYSVKVCAPEMIPLCRSRNFTFGQ